MPDLDYEVISDQINAYWHMTPERTERARDSRGRFTRRVEYRPACGSGACGSCPRVDSDGYDVNGYDQNGFDRDGYDVTGFNSRGYDRDGYNRRGFNLGRAHRNGTPYDEAGFTYHGYNTEGYDRNGFDLSGYNAEGYNAYGYDREGYDREGYDVEGYDSDGRNRCGDYRHDDDSCGDSDCTECYPSRGGLHNYTYTPTLQFRGDKAPWYGMEIEVTTDRTRKLVQVVEEYAGQLIYCKEDGSVDGAELVTHPMSYDWAMTNFPWQLLPALASNADASIVPNDNGIHIHVSRDGFDSPAHMFRWLKFWYRNPRDVQRIARRRASDWASFRPDQRAGHAEHVKYGKPNYRRSADTTRGQRYAAINTQNDATLEVRVFASTLRPQRAQAALQLVAGTVEYTRQLTADAITHRHGWDWQAFMAWTAKSGQYAALVTEDRIRRPV